MGFRTENNLVEKFKEQCIPFLGIKSNPKILQEVSVGFGIADIVISELFSKEINENSEPLDHIDIIVYKIIEEKREITVESVVEISRCSKRRINESLDKLIKLAFVRKEDTYYVFSNKYELFYKKSIAIEAKLKNWKRALMQAYRYKWFADYSYVLLDAAHTKPALKNIQMFRNLNIGLLSISTNGIIEKHFMPKKESPVDPKMQILLSETLKFSN